MAVDQAPEDYSSLFRHYVVRGARQALVAVEGAAAGLGDEGREQALHTLTYVLGMPEAWPLARDLLVALAPLLERAGYRDNWIPYLEQGIARCQMLDDRATEGELWWLLGTLRQLLGSLEEAAGGYEASARCFAQIGDQRNQARALNRLAALHRQQRRFDAALQTAADAQALLPPGDSELGYTAIVRGGVAQDQQEWALAAQHYQEGLDIWQATGDQRLVAWGLTNLGIALRYTGRVEESIACYQRAIALMDQIEDLVHAGAARSNLGNFYLHSRQYELALDLYSQAEQVFRRTRDPWRLAFVTTNLSMVHRQLGNLDSAVSYAEASIQLNRQLGDVVSAINAMDCLAEAYLSGERYTKAEAVLREAWAMLEPMKDEPGNAILAREITQHLDEAIRRRAEGQAQ